MNIEVKVSYKTSRPKRDTSAYRTWFDETADACHELRQFGPVWHDVAYNRGVYTTLREAQRAAVAYIEAP